MGNGINRWAGLPILRLVGKPPVAPGGGRIVPDNTDILDDGQKPTTGCCGGRRGVAVWRLFLGTITACRPGGYMPRLPIKSSVGSADNEGVVWLSTLA